MAAAPSRTRGFDPEDIRNTMRRFFEPQLKALGLGEEQIKEQNLDQLLQSLDRINDAIQNPDSFGKLGLSIDAEVGVFVTKSTATSTMQIGILPLLLERKRLILDRIAILKGEEKIEGLQELVQRIPDDDIRDQLQSEIKELKETSDQLRRQISEVERAQKEQSEEELDELEALARKTEIFERRSKVWLTFLERESVATIVGSILLVVIVISLLLAMFLNIETTDIVNNGFLVLLGYFFGQTISRAKADEPSAPT